MGVGDGATHTVSQKHNNQKAITTPYVIKWEKRT